MEIPHFRWCGIAPQTLLLLRSISPLSEAVTGQHQSNFSSGGLFGFKLFSSLNGESSDKLETTCSNAVTFLVYLECIAEK